jgi:hypothetical protein
MHRGLTGGKPGYRIGIAIVFFKVKRCDNSFPLQLPIVACDPAPDEKNVKERWRRGERM